MQPIHVLKSALGGGKSGKSIFRNGLIVLQFSVSIMLIVATVTVYKQVEFMKNKDLGMATDQIVAISLNNAIADRASTLIEELESIAGIDQVSFASRAPGTGAFGTIVRRADIEDESVMEMKYLMVDEKYFDVLDIKLLAGRVWQANRSPDAPPSFVVNMQGISCL